MGSACGGTLPPSLVPAVAICVTASDPLGHGAFPPVDGDEHQDDQTEEDLLHARAHLEPDEERLHLDRDEHAVDRAGVASPTTDECRPANHYRGDRREEVRLADVDGGAPAVSRQQNT